MHKSYQIMEQVFFALCKRVDTPVSLGVWLRFKYKEHLDLANVDIRPSDYLSAYSFAKDYAVVSYLSKYKGLRTGLKLDKEAWRRFNDAELSCKQTNQRFGRGVGAIPALETKLLRVQRKIADVLGPLRGFAEADLLRWGPGATFDIPRRRACGATKHSVIPSITEACIWLGQLVLRNNYQWFEAVTGIKPDGEFCVTSEFFHKVTGNRIEMVSKNAKTHRSIAAEPTVNGFIQQGVGRYVRRRLKRFGVDLDNQGVNQSLAMKAYSDRLATLDLKAASDTVARELVFSLLPPDWANLLDDLRSHAYVRDGKTVWYEKFSSMGNAFTFELESLIFYAIVSTICEDNGYHEGYSVYGDDIICPQSCASEVIDLLQYCGFSINLEKSHITGAFYESCGKHYFQGHDVTPPYQKELLEGPELVRAHNRLIRFGSRLLGTGDVSSLVKGACGVLYSAAPSDLRSCKVPYGGESDDGFQVVGADVPGSFTPGLGFHCTVFQFRQQLKAVNGLGALAHFLTNGRNSREAACPNGGSYLWSYAKSLSLVVSARDLAGTSQYLKGKLRRETRSYETVKRWILPAWEFQAAWV